MKSLIFVALFLTVAFATTIKVEPVYDNSPVPVKIPNSGVVSMLIRSTVNKNPSDLRYRIRDGELTADPAATAEIEDFEIIIHGFSILKQGIQTAITKAKEAFEKIKERLKQILLPKINFPNLVQPFIDFGKLVAKMIPCAKALYKIGPVLVTYAEKVARGDTAEAVEELLKVLETMPEITSACIDEPFEIEAEDMNLILCTADVLALSSSLSVYLYAPEFILANPLGLKNMIKMIPKTISDCTGAFA
eukprot:CAMPEP_0176430520 /NCGR_PEP_ID=MMETSP0127-20121128/14300_1 /TAXON_ID=938130 /ORGANISM="Platyophrya macrostoma, Strain WH" /LENGTH=247 /DNA_ID=CAMNT_0017812421 /DNA_START=34 /DNA_END=777 /DNA_ORIENTATION=+